MRPISKKTTPTTFMANRKVDGNRKVPYGQTVRPYLTAVKIDQKIRKIENRKNLFFEYSAYLFRFFSTQRHLVRPLTPHWLTCRWSRSEVLFSVRLA